MLRIYKVGSRFRATVRGTTFEASTLEELLRVLGGLDDLEVWQ